MILFAGSWQRTSEKQRWLGNVDTSQREIQNFGATTNQHCLLQSAQCLRPSPTGAEDMLRETKLIRHISRGGSTSGISSSIGGGIEFNQRTTQESSSPRKLFATKRREIRKSSRRSSVNKSLRRRWFDEKCLSRTLLHYHSRCSFGRPNKLMSRMYVPSKWRNIPTGRTCSRQRQNWPETWIHDLKTFWSLWNYNEDQFFGRKTGLNPGWLSAEALTNTSRSLLWITQSLFITTKRLQAWERLHLRHQRYRSINEIGGR